MFTDIASTLPYQTILFDYNTYDQRTNTLTVAPLTSQAKKLGEVITEVRSQNPDATIDLICHSQGCVTAGLLKPLGLHKIILLGPPATLSAERMAKIFGNRPGSHIDIQGVSRFARTDGSTTIVPKEYWPSIENVDPVALFNELRTEAGVIIIKANQDQIITQADFTKLSPSIHIIGIDGDHDFTGDARPKLIQIIMDELEE